MEPLERGAQVRRSLTRVYGATRRKSDGLFGGLQRVVSGPPGGLVEEVESNRRETIEQGYGAPGDGIAVDRWNQ